MKFLNNLRIALSSVKKRFFRNLVSISGIVVGTLSVLLILGLGNGLSQMLTQNMFKGFSGDKLKISYIPNDTAGTFQKSDVQLIQHLPQVKKAKLIDDNVEAYQNVTWKGKGKSLRLQVIKKGSHENQLNTIALNRYDIKGSALDNIQIGDYVYIQNIPFKVRQFYNDPMLLISGDNSGAKITQHDYQILKGRHHANYSEMDVTLAKNLTTSQSTQIKNKILTTLQEKGAYHTLGDYFCPDASAAKKQLDQIVRGIAVFIAVIAGISLVTAGMGIMTTMTANIAERTQEIGLRRSIGASKHDITLQFLLEGTLLTLSGGLISAILAVIIQLGVNSLKLHGFAMHVTATNFTTVLLIVFVIGLIFSYAPARKAAKQNIVDLIR